MATKTCVTRLAIPFLTACMLLLTPVVASAAPAPAPSDTPTTRAARASDPLADFICLGAVRLTRCHPYGYFTARTTTVQVAINNHASGGESCIVRNTRTGGFIPPRVFINPGDGSFKNLARLQAGTVFDIWCQRRNFAGDAGIGGIVRY
ncbi:hypothetical protein SAMN05661093_03652 [Kibdelosporangium aridum]|uniref:Uncharacterized protein n=1 Tax=Kibdelosporangium aridum TaxID=2030 RepID=A0A1W2DP37_KIBAR|nr:hypothetical protein SAMN05661093_03652 [Kibdelosporangium aridum]